MLDLCRTVRFCLNGDANRPPAARHNGYAAWPPMRGLGRFYELDVCCAGEADPLTGYFLNITHIDAAVREHVLPYLAKTLETSPRSDAAPMGEIMQRMISLLDAPL